jgi:hypothetical protein
MCKRHLWGGVCTGSISNQCWGFVGLSVFWGLMNDPTGTTTCFGFLGFLASLFPRTWPLAMVLLLAATLKNVWPGLRNKIKHSTD